MSASPFNWSKLIAGISNASSGIPTDVTFQIVDERGAKRSLHEVKAHKMILAMVSDIFQTMFYSTDVGDRTISVIKIEKTTAPAFRIMLDAVYNIKSLRESLMGKSVDEVFEVVNLLERYHIVELMEVAKDHLANYLVTEDTVLEVAGHAMEYTGMFEAEANQLIITCAKFLKHKLKDLNSVIDYAAENENHRVVLATLLARMKDFLCPNCKKETCLDGLGVRKGEFREGLLVTSNGEKGGWGNKDYGTGRVKKVNKSTVIIVSVKPGVTRNGWKLVQSSVLIMRIITRSGIGSQHFFFLASNLSQPKEYHGGMETAIRTF